MAPPCIMIGTVSNYLLILLEAIALLPINCTLSLWSEKADCGCGSVIVMTVKSWSRRLEYFPQLNCWQSVKVLDFASEQLSRCFKRLHRPYSAKVLRLLLTLLLL